MKREIALAALALLIAGAFHGAAAGPRCQPKPAPGTSEVTLTQAQPKARVAIPSEVLANPTPFLEVPITRILNTAQTPFSIFVYLEWTETHTDPGAHRKILLGNFSVYPPDRPGTYILRASDGLQRLEALGVRLEQNQVGVLLEMKRIFEAKPSTPIQVTVGPLRWRDDRKRNAVGQKSLSSRRR